MCDCVACLCEDAGYCLAVCLVCRASVGFYVDSHFLFIAGMLDDLMGVVKIKVALVGIYRFVLHGCCCVYIVWHEHVYGIFVP